MSLARSQPSNKNWTISAAAWRRKSHLAFSLGDRLAGWFTYWAPASALTSRVGAKRALAVLKSHMLARCAARAAPTPGCVETACCTASLRLIACAAEEIDVAKKPQRRSLAR